MVRSMYSRTLDSKPFQAELAMSEIDFLEAFDRQMQTDHLNPERAGCPVREILAQLANAPESFHCHEILVHMGRCVPCLQELIQLRSSGKRQTKTRIRGKLFRRWPLR